MGRRNFIISLIIYENRNVVKLDVPNLESTLKYSKGRKRFLELWAIVAF